MSSEPAPTAAGRLDRRRERTRGRLVDATRTLIAEKGVAGLRISEITDRADVALGSFYNYFSSKEEVVEAVVAESLSELAGRLDTSTVEDPAEVVAIAIRRVVGLAYEDRDFAILVVYLDHADALFATALQPAAVRAVRAGIRSKRFTVASTEVAVTTLVGGGLALMRSIVDGRIGKAADVIYAEMALRALGVSARDAADIARRPLPG